MKAADFKKKRESTYYGLVQVSSVACVNSFKLRFLGSYLNSLIGDLDNSRFTKSRFRSLTTENTYIFVFLALSRKFEWKNTMGNIYFCLFVFFNFFNKVRMTKYDFFVFSVYLVIDIYFVRGNQSTNYFCS